MSPACSATFYALPKLPRDALTPLCHPLTYWKNDLKNTFPAKNPPSDEGGCWKSSECTVSSQSRAQPPPSHRNHHPGFGHCDPAPCSQRSEHKSPSFPNSMLFRLMTINALIFRSPAFSRLQTECISGILTSTVGSEAVSHPTPRSCRSTGEALARFNHQPPPSQTHKQ